MQRILANGVPFFKFLSLRALKFQATPSLINNQTKRRPRIRLFLLIAKTANENIRLLPVSSPDVPLRPVLLFNYYSKQASMDQRLSNWIRNRKNACCSKTRLHENLSKSTTRTTQGSSQSSINAATATNSKLDNGGGRHRTTSCLLRFPWTAGQQKTILCPVGLLRPLACPL